MTVLFLVSAFTTIVAVAIKECSSQEFRTGDFSSYRGGRLLILPLCSVYIGALTGVSVCSCSLQVTFSFKARTKFLHKSNQIFARV